VKTPADIKFLSSELQIEWDDQTKIKIPYYHLRCSCPCAYCVDEFTGEKILKNENVSLGIMPLSSELVGAYAMQIKWSDQHSSGIFTWDFLESFGESSVGADSVPT
jgi:DUF971 family protein